MSWVITEKKIYPHFVHPIEPWRYDDKTLQCEVEV